MASYLKLVGTFIIGGLMMLTINRAIAYINQTSNERILDSISNQTADGIVQLIEFDFNRAGLGVNRQENALILAQPDSIRFLADINEDGVIETISYVLSDTSVANNTENPNDRILYRHMSGETMIDAAMGVTQFNVRYFDWFGNETSTLKDIKSFEITLEVQSIASYGSYFSHVSWQTRISPPNLRRY